MAKSDSEKKEINKFLYFYRVLATVELDVSKAKTLTLIMESADGNIDYDHGTWGDAKFIKDL